MTTGQLFIYNDLCITIITNMKIKASILGQAVSHRWETVIFLYLNIVLANHNLLKLSKIIETVFLGKHL